MGFATLYPSYVGHYVGDANAALHNPLLSGRTGLLYSAGSVGRLC